MKKPSGRGEIGQNYQTGADHTQDTYDGSQVNNRVHCDAPFQTLANILFHRAH